jgi:hypothetical protein
VNFFKEDSFQGETEGLSDESYGSLTGGGAGDG